MADNSTRIVICAEDKTSAAFRSAQHGLEGLQSSFASVAAMIGGAGIAGGLIAATKSAIDLGDSLNKMAQKTGIAVESLSALKYAGELSDVSIEAIGNSLKKLAVNMNEAAASGKGEAAAAFKAIGVAVADAAGNLRGADAVMGDVADRFAKMEDGAGKTALAVAIFGRAGADMIPLLNQGSRGIKAMADEAKELGAIMGGDFARASEEFNDNLTRISTSMEAFKIVLASGIIGDLVKFTNALVASAKATGGFASGLLLLDGDQSMNPVKAFYEVEERLAKLKKSKEEMQGSWVGKNLPIFNADDIKILDAQIAFAEKQRKALYDLANKEGAFDYGPPVIAGKKTKAPTFSSTAEKIGKSKKAREFDPEGDVMFAIQESIEKQKRQGYIEAEKALQAEADALEKLTEKYRGIADPLKKYKDELDEINTLKERGTLTDAEAANATRNVTKEMDDQIAKMSGLKDIGKELGMTFSSAFEDAIVGGKAFGDVIKGLGDDIVRLLMRKNITEPLADGIKNTDWAGMFSGWFKNADGGVYSGAGISAYSGQIVSKPTVFPFANGIGLMGEAGNEAILPLKRGANGKLGVQGGGSNVVVNVIESPGNGGKTERRNENGVNIIDIFVDKVKSAIAGDIADGRGAVPSALSSTYGLNRVAGAY